MSTLYCNNRSDFDGIDNLCHAKTKMSSSGVRENVILTKSYLPQMVLKYV